jgi:hypothetical protein
MKLIINNFEINNINDFKQIIEQDKNILNQYFLDKPHKCNIYLYVAICGKPEMLKYLEEYLSDFKNYVDKHNKDAYVLALQYGNLENMKYFDKEHNWDVVNSNKKQLLGDNHYFTQDIYIIACAHGDLEIMKYLEKNHKWSIYVKDASNLDVYVYAVYYRHLEIMKYLDNKHNWQNHDYIQYAHDNIEIKTYLKNKNKSKL